MVDPREIRKAGTERGWLEASEQKVESLQTEIERLKGINKRIAAQNIREHTESINLKTQLALADKVIDEARRYKFIIGLDWTLIKQSDDEPAGIYHARCKLENALAEYEKGTRKDEQQESDGCLCQGCNNRYKVDYIIPDDLWKKIKPHGKSDEGGMLCGKCIINRIEKLNVFKGLVVYIQESNPATPQISTNPLDVTGHLGSMGHRNINAKKTLDLTQSFENMRDLDPEEQAAFEKHVSKNHKKIAQSRACG